VTDLLRNTEKLANDLTRVNTEGRLVGPGLLTQCRAALGAPRPVYGEVGRTSRQVGSKPPGWRDDVSELLTDMAARTAYWRGVYGVRPSRDLERDLASLPDIVWADKLPDLARDMRRWRTRARRALGYLPPVIDLPNVVCGKRKLTAGGWITLGCGQATLRVAADASSDVWCANPGCHDDAEHPHCRSTTTDWMGYDLDLGYAPGALACRADLRDTWHAVTWSPGEWLAMARKQGVA